MICEETITFVQIIEMELCRDGSEELHNTIIDGPFPRDRLNAEVNRPEVHVKWLSSFSTAYVMALPRTPSASYHVLYLGGW